MIMKFLPILLVFVIGLSVSAFSQQKAAQGSSREELLSQSKKQKTTAFVLLGAGAVGTGAGAALISSNFCIFGCTDSQDRALGVGSGLFVAGGIAMLASIPVFISAANKSKQAYRISASSQPILIPELGQNGPRSIPTIKVSFSLNR
jgi:hypothetical protein